MRRIIDSINSRHLVLISIISSVILFILCIVGGPRLDLAIVFIISQIFFLVSFFALRGAAKKRRQENETQYKSRTNRQNLYENIPTNTDLYIAIVVMFTSSALLFSEYGMPSLGICILIAIIAVLFIGCSPAYDNSMLPTIGYGDWLITERWLFFRRTIKRGDIVSFAPPPGLKIDWPKEILRKQKLSLFLGPSLLKRIVGMPGETIRITNSKVYINHKQLEEDKTIPPAIYEINFLGDLGNDKYKPYSDPEFSDKPITIPKGHYFVLGDLRINENIDSHVFGFVPEQQIHGRVIATFPFGARSVTISRSELYGLIKHLLATKKLLQEKKFAESIEECSMAIAASDQCAPAFAYRAQAKQGLKQWAEAIDDCNKAINLYQKTKDPLPGHWESIALPYFTRSQCYNQLKNYQEALNDCNKVVKLLPKNANVYIIRADIFRGMKKYNQSLQDCNHALEIAPKSNVAYIMRAAVNRLTNKLNAVLSDCSKAEKLGADKQETYLLRAKAYNGLNRFQDAYDECTRALDLEPSAFRESSAYSRSEYNHIIYAIRGAACIFLKKWSDALEDLNKAVRTGSQNAKDFSNRAFAYFELGQYDKSLEDCETAIKLDPSLAPAYKNRARVNLQYKQPQFALDDLNKAIELDPKRRDFHYYRSQAYRALGDNALADKDSTKARKLGYVPAEVD